MDGWETRRRRGVSAHHPWPAVEDHDWALVRLGAPGVIRGIVVDTAHFRGNYPQSVLDLGRLRAPRPPRNCSPTT
ncbi:allantoicase [Streptomyces glaucescens]